MTVLAYAAVAVPGRASITAAIAGLACYLRAVRHDTEYEQETAHGILRRRHARQ